MYSRRPTGMPKILMPCWEGGNSASPFHTTAPGSSNRAASWRASHPGGKNPPLFHTRVFPWFFEILQWFHNSWRITWRQSTVRFGNDLIGTALRRPRSSFKIRQSTAHDNRLSVKHTRTFTTAGIDHRMCETIRRIRLVRISRARLQKNKFIFKISHKIMRKRIARIVVTYQLVNPET